MHSLSKNFRRESSVQKTGWAQVCEMLQNKLPMNVSIPRTNLYIGTLQLFLNEVTKITKCYFGKLLPDASPEQSVQVVICRSRVIRSI